MAGASPLCVESIRMLGTKPVLAYTGDLGSLLGRISRCLKIVVIVMADPKSGTKLRGHSPFHLPQGH